jgi:protein TonB
MREKKDNHFIKKPIYPGGNDAFKKFIKDNLKYPKLAFEKEIEGTVLLRYAIDYKGKVSDVKVIKSLGYGCDEEAIRIIKLLSFEIPKEPRKLKVLFHKDTKIFFKMPKKQKTETTISYTVSTIKKKPEQDTSVPKVKKSYSYTVNI